MFSEAKVTEIFCMADDFCKEFAKTQKNIWFLKTQKRTSQDFETASWR